MKRHKDTVHEHRKDAICDLCDKSFTSNHNLIEHRKVKHSNFRYQCNYCDKNCANKLGLKMHVDENHPVGPAKKFKCDQCPKEYKRSTYLYQHKKYNHETNERFVCKICGKIPSTKIAFYSHRPYLQDSQNQYS